MDKMTDEMIVALHLKGKEKYYPFAPLAFHSVLIFESQDFYIVNLYQESNPIGELNAT